jgi:hypothetical protein
LEVDTNSKELKQLETHTTVVVTRVDLSGDMEKRVALASVQIGPITIQGIAVWKSPKGKLRLFLPSYRSRYGFDDAVILPQELQVELEASVFAAYKQSLDKSQVRKDGISN